MGECVLVVEDDAEIRDGIGIYLKNQGYTVVKAANGREGLRALEENEVHLAIVDVMMPVGKVRSAGYHAVGKIGGHRQDHRAEYRCG